MRRKSVPNAAHAYIKNDTERLEKLFELYTKMTAAAKSKPAMKAIRG